MSIDERCVPVRIGTAPTVLTFLSAAFAAAISVALIINGAMGN
jgi:hypothetical protein